MIEILVICSVTLSIFLATYFVQKKYPVALLNPLLLSVVIIIGLLSWFEMSYQDYMQGAQYINYLLEPAVVMLGFPLYKQRYLLRVQWPKILAICCCASFTAITLIVLLAHVLGIESWLIVSMVTMNITTAIAMSTAVELGGNASMAAVMVLVAGVSGSIVGLAWLRLIGLVELTNSKGRVELKHSHQQHSLGMAIGSVSHALGTSSIAKSFPVAAAYASSALILCAIITAIIAPIYVPFLLGMIGI
ncbi:LrgB family protein [Paraglaciecola aquimarina]|uniref:LrgB family protein n=1 Tax=Paraglaciecola aquimarina TaxID=1235557 RepID=A0ABU3SWC1_9ALTE|nr:LrgB family protein [Paraglaciecola aquimarina]MDU0354313.1 LrgB family protein [Paraglaciecola aquimarina]